MGLGVLCDRFWRASPGERQKKFVKVFRWQFVVLLHKHIFVPQICLSY